ncbi:LysR family transcriptional regulator [Xylophilus sp. GW821-FHT01B05]
MESLSGLAVFVQTAKTQSFVSTGRALGISASAVSKSISRLEDRLGVRLFQRSTRSVRLTTEGDVFLERCQRILVELEGAEQEMSAMNRLPRGRLRVGLSYAAGLPMPAIAGFMERYPEIELDLDFSDRLTDVIDEGLDLVIRGGEPSDSRLVSRRLGVFRICLVAAPSYLARRGQPAKPADLVQHDCLHYRYPSSGRLEPWPLRHSSKAADGLVLPMSMVSSNLEALLYLVKAGRGIACVPDFAVKSALAAGELRLVLDGHMKRSTTFRVLWPSSKQMSPKVRVFVDYMVANFGHGLSGKAEADTPG